MTVGHIRRLLAWHQLTLEGGLLKKAKIPGPPEPGWWNWIYKERNLAWLELGGGVSGAVPIIYKAIREPNQALRSWSLWPALIVLLLLVLRGVVKIFTTGRKDAQELDRDDPMHLLGPLRVLHGLVCERKGIKNDESDRLRFRVTIHRVLKAEKKTKASQEKHQQCVPYVGGKAIDPTKVIGRTWPNSCGIVGKAIRSGGKEAKGFVSAPGVATEDEYYRELSDLFGYDLDEVRKLQPMRLSAIAIPILSSSQVIGVVYCDSSERDFFDADTASLCVQISAAVAHHIDQTYRR